MRSTDYQQTEATTPAAFHIVVGLLFLVFSALIVYIFLNLFAPRPYVDPTEAFTGYDPAPLQLQVAPEAVQAQLDTILDFGNRFVGYDGFYQTADYIRQAYEAAGLKVYEQQIRVPAPRTEIAQVLDSNNRPIDVQIYPLLPNHLQPMTTGSGFVEGELLVITEEMLYDRQDFTNCIALIDTAMAAPTGYGLNWARYARLGFEAVIVSHAEGLDMMNWPALNAMISIAPVNYLRLVSDPELFDYAGQHVRLKVVTRFVDAPVTTLVGVLEAGGDKAEEAVVIPVTYDALSNLPDLSPGPFQAINLALQLQLVSAFSQYRDSLRRDVVFCAFGARSMAFAAHNEFLRAIGANSDRGARRIYAETKMAEHRRMLALITTNLQLLDDDAFLQDRAKTMAAINALPADARKIFADQYQYILNSLVFDLSEQMLHDKIIFEKGNTNDLTTPEFQAYRASKDRYDKAFSAAGFPIGKLLERRAEFIEEYEISDRLRQRLQLLTDFHREQVTLFEQNLQLYSVLRGYRQFTVFAPDFAPAESPMPRESLSFSMGWQSNQQDHEQVVKDIIMGAVSRLDLTDSASLWLSGNPRQHANQVHGKVSGMQLISRYWYRSQYPAFSFVSADRTYKDHASPIVLPYMRELDNLGKSFSVFAESVLSVSHGTGDFNTVRQAGPIPDFFGNVYVANVGQSIIPNYPLKQALVADKGNNPAVWAPKNGFFNGLMQFTNPYGSYDLTHCIGDFVQSTWSFSPTAAAYNQFGQINLIKDEGGNAQKIFKSNDLRASDVSEAVNIVTFRSSPITLLDLINAQTLQAYAGVEFIRSKGLSSFPSQYMMRIGQDLVTVFLRPDEYFYVRLRAGSITNEQVQETRAFMLGVSLDDIREVRAQEEVDVRMGSEIRGDGYLAMESPFIRDVPTEVAKSMAFVNLQRLKLQQKYNMVDPRTVEFQEKSAELLEEAMAEDQSKHATIQSARGAVTYATLNHPILRGNINEAVKGILFYLGLLVPFVFFFEKLIFGFTDIRKQLAVHGITFLAVFLILRVLHPAFSMIRSSLMILLGFVILLIATGIMALFFSKFKENLEAIRKQQGRVSEAEVNKFGAIAIAFMLGLNNMHRRRVRTLLTCGTLILITFVMICFTSIRSDLVERSQAVGRAPYPGFLVKNEDYVPMQTPELSALQDKYGRRFVVAPRYMYVGIQDPDTRERLYPQIEVIRRTEESTRNAFPHTILRLSYEEPLAPLLPLQGSWFTREQETIATQTIPIIISQNMATRLGIDPAELEDGKTFDVTIGGQHFEVQGAFLGSDLERLLDLDGRNLLPFDVKSVRQLNFHGNNMGMPIASDDSPQMPGETTIIMPLRDPGLNIQRGFERISSVAVALPPTLSYRETKDIIDGYMEQRGKQTYYGLDKYSFSGIIARSRSFVGLLDMLVPLIIAAFTVLNTIRGSVYERRDEIFVYNAVGIAPGHIFFIFFAESIVYAVVGSVLGYILSQGTGKVLTAMDLTGGLNMSFTSVGTIYASIVIMLAVFLSTIFPARSAKRIAAPSTDVGWRLPEPEGGVLQFNLPFTFNYSDRLGVLEFFRRYLVDHGEGSSGAFFAGPPEFGISEAEEGYVPQLSAMVWLKPFDLGVSQRVIIALPTDPETGEYIANITLLRQSGTRDNWRRLNSKFIRLMRRQFLHWRAVQHAERKSMFEEASRRLTESVESTGTVAPALSTYQAQGGADG